MTGLPYDEIAQICHAANCALQDVQALSAIPTSPAWEDLSEEARESIIAGVVGVIDWGNTPKQSHQSWLKFKEEHGWVYGAVKDEVSRTHPCMVPYEELPAEQRAKDRLFVAISRALS